MTTTMPKTLAENISYCYQLGWSFTALDGKKPRLKNWQSTPRESLDQAMIWARRGNVGLRTGAASGGLLVIDLDINKPKYDDAAVRALDLPATITSVTGSGGYHLLYRVPTNITLGNSCGKLAPAVDTRGEGGQIVFPGSKHPESGKLYEWYEGSEPWSVEIAELPERIIELLMGDKQAPAAQAGPSSKLTTAGDHAKYISVAVERELEAVRQAAEGNRNQQLNSSAFNLGTLVGGGYLDRGEVESLLTSTVAQCGWDFNDEGRRQTASTIASGLTAGIAHPRRIPDNAPAAVPVTATGRPSTYILIPGSHCDSDGVYVEQGTAHFACDVLAALPADTIYRKLTIPGQLLGGAGERIWCELRPDELRIMVDRCLKLGQWIKTKEDEQALVYKTCTKDLAGVIISQARMAPGIRDLDLLVSYPIYGPGWHRVLPGWHDRLYYDEPEALKGIQPETECEVIHNVLDDLVTDFPFASQADKENFFGLMLTPIIAPALDGNRPMHLITTSLERTGKSKLAEEVWGGVIMGAPTPAMQITEHEDERDKRILAMLRGGGTMVHFDNLPSFIESGTLSSLLTASTYSGRVLGRSEQVKLPNYLTIVGTGNNTQASGEIVKRVVPIVLQPKDARPESRRNFAHPDLRAYVRKQRRLVLSCLLGLVENWKKAGRPAHTVPLGSFESWARTVGGILQVNGLRAWRTNEKGWRTESDPHGAEMESFVDAWWSAYGTAEVSAIDLRGLASGCATTGREPYFADVLAGAGGDKRFGRMLAAHKNRPVGEYLIRHSRVNSRPRYRLEKL